MEAAVHRRRNTRFVTPVAASRRASWHGAAAGATIYDFLAGENQLKTSFATDRNELTLQVPRPPRLKYRLESAARRAKQRLFGPATA